MLRPLSRQIRFTCWHGRNWRPDQTKPNPECGSRIKVRLHLLREAFNSTAVTIISRGQVAAKDSTSTHVACHGHILLRPCVIRASSKISYLPYVPLVYRQRSPDLEIFKQTNQNLTRTRTTFFVTRSTRVSLPESLIVLAADSISWNDETRRRATSCADVPFKPVLFAIKPNAET
jgi:hypothetical protein